jgi:hypothetical protein
VVGCPSGKISLAYATFEIIMFHCGWCPIRSLSTTVGCTLVFYFITLSYVSILC